MYYEWSADDLMRASVESRASPSLSLPAPPRRSRSSLTPLLRLARSATPAHDAVQLAPRAQQVGVPAAQPGHDPRAQEGEAAEGDELGRDDPAHPPHAVRPPLSLSLFPVAVGERRADGALARRHSPGTSDFLSTQIASMHRLHAELAKKQQLKSQRGSLQRSGGANGGLAGGSGRGGGGGARGGLARGSQLGTIVDE